MPRRDDIDRLYHTKSWERIRRMALERDKGLCQVCLSRSVYKQGDTVHHKQHARDDVSLFYELDNLETICREHHNKAHPEKMGSKKKVERDDVVKF
ncbi:HNH endonuclease [Weissella tructae]|uniref:Putative HNH nuclease YajD n=2 Tax=Weissella TaxID=46255 RepID=A0A075U614_9LACO|nr:MULTISPECIES: HNH endonuclease signature motif containing protein [Weissella]AIG65562.1 HNH endonuclease domain protein [Weissella tructae]AIM62876.1 HNH endonuclease domain protein [Weissella ceti]AIM64274.1 HNH endonuclease domain protein [Weissella ceti]ELA06980.1 hypothetical protein WCNC_05352 [Weissella ceti NC36]QVV90694.1 HNH endonuclease [Weissella tructae]